MTLDRVGEVLIPEQGIRAPGDIPRVSQILSDQFGLPMTMDQKAKKGGAILTCIIVPHHCEDLGVRLQDGGRGNRLLGDPCRVSCDFFDQVSLSVNNCSRHSLKCAKQPGV